MTSDFSKVAKRKPPKGATGPQGLLVPLSGTLAPPDAQASWLDSEHLDAHGLVVYSAYSHSAWERRWVTMWAKISATIPTSLQKDPGLL